MKSKTLTCITAMMLFAALALPVRLDSQDNRDHRHKHHHYKLIDMGTFGGPQSSNFPLFAGTLNKRGVTIGWSATPTPMTIPPSNPLICGGLNGVGSNVTHSFAWQDGVVADLGSLGGADFCSDPLWVNDRGEIVGASEDGQIDPVFGFHRARAVLWRDGEIIDLGSLGGGEVLASSINNHGQIVGFSTNTIPDPYCFFGTVQVRVFLWQHGQMQDLGTLGGNCATTGPIDVAGNPINDKGQIVGGSTTSSIPNPITGIPPWDPFLWEEGTGMIDLGTLGGVYGGAQGINNRGQVIGQSSIAADPGACNGFPDNGNDNCHPFLWDHGTLIDLNTSSMGGNPNYVAAIDDAGDIIGTGAFLNAASDAFLWRNGVVTDLGNLGYCQSHALGINSQSQVVGFAASCDFSVGRAFLWEHGSMVDLNTLIPPGPSLYSAMQINDRGEINANGALPNGDGRAFLLIPCDEHHRDSECEEEGESTAAIIQNPAPVDQTPTNVNHGGLTPETLAALRTRLARRYRGFGAWPGK
jgi:probable HAF family extracellular repeat protein